MKQGERRYLPNVQVTLEADWTCNLAITWTRATPSCPAELCVLMTNLRPNGWVLRHYLKRMHIEIVASKIFREAMRELSTADLRYRVPSRWCILCSSRSALSRLAWQLR